MMQQTFLNSLPQLKVFIERVEQTEIQNIDLGKYISIIDIRIQQQIISLVEILHFYEYCEQQEFLKMHSSKNWTDEEWKVLLWITLQYCNIQLRTPTDIKLEDWDSISTILAFKDSQNCHFKWSLHLKVQQTNRSWNHDEDQLLLQIILSQHVIKWHEVQYEMHIQSNGKFFRKAKQFRERWNNYLNPEVNSFNNIRGIWTEQDDINLLNYALQDGLRWSSIAKKMKNRTENQVKNRFKSLINKEKKLINPVNSQQENSSQNEKSDRQGIDATTEQIINSIIGRLKPKEKVPTPQPEIFQNFIPPPQQIPQFQYNPIIFQQQQFYYPQVAMTYFQPQPYIPNPLFAQAYFSQQVSPQSSLHSISSHQSQDQLLKSDNIKEEPSSSSGQSIQAKEPKIYKNICVSQNQSARSSANGSTSSQHSLDMIKHMSNLQLGDQPDNSNSRKHKRSQSNAFDVQNKAKTKTKRSRFFYQSNES